LAGVTVLDAERARSKIADSVTVAIKDWNKPDLQHR